MKHRHLIGAHVSIAQGLDQSVVYAKEIGGNCMQIFTQSNRSWHGRVLAQEEIEKFKETRKAHLLEKVISHASYLINVASPEERVRTQSCKALVQEYERCTALEIDYVVFHPGSRLTSSHELGRERIAQAINKVLEVESSTLILLETAAGQGTNIGSTFEELHLIRSLCEDKKRVGYCLDTCHIHAAGYDLSTVESFFSALETFDAACGLSNLHAIHLNNSKTACGSFKDRHEKISKGTIPAEVFQVLMKEKSLEHIPKILETPLDETYLEYKEEIQFLISE